jgi:hypothetical protein
MPSPADNIQINLDYFGPGNGLYIIPARKGFSTLGFDRLMQLGNALAAELDRWDLTPLPAERGTMQAYEKYAALVEVARQRHVATGFRSRVGLTPQLVGLEGKRVEIVDSYGERRRFQVGRSTGWVPCHLEISRRNATGGPAVTGTPFKSVTVVGT